MPDLLNMTPHPIRLYGPDTPDRVSDLTAGLILTLPPASAPARLAEIRLGTASHVPLETHSDGQIRVPVEFVEYGMVHNLPERQEDVYLVVPLIVALAAHVKGDRPDLLFPYAQVRNEEGVVVGCRTFARPC